MAPGLAGSDGDALTTSRADPTSDGGTNCEDGTSTWVDGRWFEAEEGEGTAINVASGQCTEVAFTIDTTQATPSRTYRFIVATEDNGRKDKGPWRGPVTTSQYPTLTMADATVSILPETASVCSVSPTDLWLSLVRQRETGLCRLPWLQMSGSTLGT